MASGITTEQIQAWLDGSPAIRFLGLTVLSTDAGAGRISVRMAMRPEFERAAGSGQFHGGPIASLIDTVGDFAVALMVGGGVPTINFRVDYLRPAFGAHLVANAHVRRHGRTVAVADVDVLDEQGRLCAIGRGTYGAQPG